MTMDAGFETYLMSKKIDSQAFRKAEPELWESWKKEFEQMHPNSFTVQKLNLINPIRRKYQLKAVPVSVSPETPPVRVAAPAPVVKPGRPIMKPKLKPDS
jgi:hypothetical protein